MRKIRPVSARIAATFLAALVASGLVLAPSAAQSGAQLSAIPGTRATFQLPVPGATGTLHVFKHAATVQVDRDGTEQPTTTPPVSGIQFAVAPLLSPDGSPFDLSTMAGWEAMTALGVEAFFDLEVGEPERLAITDANGRATFLNLPIGLYRVWEVTATNGGRVGLAEPGTARPFHVTMPHSAPIPGEADHREMRYVVHTYPKNAPRDPASPDSVEVELVKEWALRNNGGEVERLTAAEGAALGLHAQLLVNQVATSWGSVIGEFAGQITLAEYVRLDAPLCEWVGTTYTQTSTWVTGGEEVVIARDTPMDPTGTVVSLVRDEYTIRITNEVECRTFFSVYQAADEPDVAGSELLRDGHQATVPVLSGYYRLDDWEMQLWRVSDDGTSLVQDDPGLWTARSVDDGTGRYALDPCRAAHQFLCNSLTKIPLVPVEPDHLLTTVLPERTAQFILREDPNRLERLAESKRAGRIAATGLDQDHLWELADQMGSKECWLADLSGRFLHNDAGQRIRVEDGEYGYVQAPLGHHTICEKTAATARLAVAKRVDRLDAAGNLIPATLPVDAWDIEVRWVDEDGNTDPSRPALLVESEDEHFVYFRVEPGANYVVTQLPPNEAAARGYRLIDSYLEFATEAELIAAGKVANVETLSPLQAHLAAHPFHVAQIGLQPSDSGFLAHPAAFHAPVLPSGPAPGNAVRPGGDVRLASTGSANSVLVSLNAVETGTVVFHSRAVAPRGASGLHVTGTNIALLIAACALLGGGTVLMKRHRRSSTAASTE